MLRQIKVVIDANVIISSLIGGGIPSNALFLALSIGSVYRPPEMEKELFAFLEEIEKQASKKGALFSEKQRGYVRKFFTDFLKETKPHRLSQIQNFSRDKADNVYIAVALETKAQFLITGDKDLLTLKKQFETLHIVNPREFVNLMTNSKIKR